MSRHGSRRHGNREAKSLWLPQSTSIHFLIHYVGGGYEEVIRKVESWLRDGHTLHASAMAWAEFLCGPLLPEENALAAELLHSVLPITAGLAVEAGRLFHETDRRSRSLADCLIATAAVVARVPLATKNRDDFEPFLAHGLELI